MNFGLDDESLAKVGDLFKTTVGELNDVIKQTVIDKEQADQIIGQLSNIIQGMLLGLQGIEDKSQNDVKSILLGVDGGFIEIGPFQIGGIDVSKIPIRISLPNIIKEKSNV